MRRVARSEDRDPSPFVITKVMRNAGIAVLRREVHPGGQSQARANVFVSLVVLGVWRNSSGNRMSLAWTRFQIVDSERRKHHAKVISGFLEARLLSARKARRCGPFLCGISPCFTSTDNGPPLYTF